MPTPIALSLDDSCPLVRLARSIKEEVHGQPPVTADGRPLPDVVPNDFPDRVCDVCEEQGMAGKISIVPAPAGRGDAAQGIEGHDPALTEAWIDAAKRRLGSRFDFCPEGLTHALAVDLETSERFPRSESDWSQTQTRETLTPRLTLGLQILKAAGIDATGITSP
jgi:hypothetical protein